MYLDFDVGVAFGSDVGFVDAASDDVASVDVGFVDVGVVDVGSNDVGFADVGSDDVASDDFASGYVGSIDVESVDVRSIDVGFVVEFDVGAAAFDVGSAVRLLVVFGWAFGAGWTSTNTTFKSTINP